MKCVLEVSPEELKPRAQAIQYLIQETLAQLGGLPPHPQRTRLGRHLTAAFALAVAWERDGSMDSSKGVHPHG